MSSAATDRGMPDSLLLREGNPLAAQAASMLRLTQARPPHPSLYAPWQLQDLAAPAGDTAEAIDRAAHLTALLLPGT